MSHPAGNFKNKENATGSTASRRTQTDSESKSVSSKRESIVIKVTDYTITEGGTTETSGSAESSTEITSSGTEVRRKIGKRRSARKTKQLEELRNEVAAGYESSSDDDNPHTNQTQSYDFLEGERLVTSLTNLSLSDIEDDRGAVPIPLVEMQSNNDKLPKIL